MFCDFLFPYFIVIITFCLFNSLDKNHMFHLLVMNTILFFSRRMVALYPPYNVWLVSPMPLYLSLLQSPSTPTARDLSGKQIFIL